MGDPTVRRRTRCVCPSARRSAGRRVGVLRVGVLHVGVLVLGLLFVGACSGGSSSAGSSGSAGSAGSSGSAGTSGASGSAGTSGASGGSATIRVLAASSLAGVLPDLVAGFRKEHPEVVVEASTGASTALVEQVRAGADADVVLTADRTTAAAAAAVGERNNGNGTGVSRATGPSPVPFATSTMVIAVPAGNPGEVRTLAALSDPELLVGLCAPQVPCGKYARQLLEQAGVTASVDTEEPDARSLMAKIASGDLDAGLVYRTDVLAAGRTVRAVDVPGAAQVPVTYFAVERSGGAGADFVAYLQGPGQKVLAAAGFGAP